MTGAQRLLQFRINHYMVPSCIVLKFLFFLLDINEINKKNAKPYIGYTFLDCLTACIELFKSKYQIKNKGENYMFMPKRKIGLFL